MGVSRMGEFFLRQPFSMPQGNKSGSLSVFFTTLKQENFDGQQEKGCHRFRKERDR
jgi:hypothetical protein